jgi:hypothetical protein
MRLRTTAAIGCLCVVAACSGALRSPVADVDAGTGATGAAGAAAAGTGGSSGTCDKGGFATPLGDSCVLIRSRGGCNLDEIPGNADDLPCWNTCGPMKSGFKNCTCVDHQWSCPVCDYDIADPRAFDCFRTDGAMACPPDPTDSSGMMLPASGGACTQPPCQPCGSATASAYRDSSGTPKAGWCVCFPRTDGQEGGVYSCASVTEWAPRCL